MKRFHQPYFHELEGFNRAIQNLKPADALTCTELFAKDEQTRKQVAQDKRARKAAKRLCERQ